jgi:hypothetical protein
MPGASSLLSSLPLGLIMFGGTAFALLRRKWNRKRTAQDFPSLAQELGLEYTAPRYAGAAGTLAGTYAERIVRIDPDDQRLLKVRFHGTPRVDLRSYEHTAAAPFDMTTIYSRDRDFDRFFRTRYATEAISRRIVGEPRLGRYVEAFQGSHARQIQSVTVTSEGVVCRFDYMSGEALQALLPACVDLADLIEPGPAAALSEPPVSEPGLSEAPPAEAAAGESRVDPDRA